MNVDVSSNLICGFLLDVYAMRWSDCSRSQVDVDVDVYGANRASMALPMATHRFIYCSSPGPPATRRKVALAANFSDIKVRTLLCRVAHTWILVFGYSNECINEDGASIVRPRKDVSSHLLC